MFGGVDVENGVGGSCTAAAGPSDPELKDRMRGKIFFSVIAATSQSSGGPLPCIEQLIWRVITNYAPTGCH
ncbi:MAG: hypothetical protein ACRCYS_12175 [Beijerinckiaceae bacterium]|nr:hypothetical protein [Hyphomicrobium sp.]